MRVALACTLGACALLAACSFGTPAAVSNVRFDLGPAAAVPPSADKLPVTMRVFEVRASHALDSDAILYRLSYADPRRTAAYANSHWTMTPALLLTQRVRAALAAQGAVLAGGEAVDAPLLTVDLEQFEQVFDSEGQSIGALTARVTLSRAGKVLAQRTFVARAPADLPNAAGGVHALAVASDEFVAQLVAWLGMQTFASTP
ncbi:ABC transporter [Trinickia fusca]|uniref:ABC transporter n=2 Tax=Trinickia fusca TaxID=2419777 RepID=A0A494XFI0_9BURK|nr:ABC transporter [Trinickia fusca]